MWLSPADGNQFNLPGYRAKYHHRPADRHGGAAIFISDTISYSRCSDISISTTLCESVWLELGTCFLPSGKNTIVASIYRSPSSSYSDFCNELDCIISSLNAENKNIIILGNINIDITDINDGSCSEYTRCILGHGID